MPEDITERRLRDIEERLEAIESHVGMAVRQPPKAPQVLPKR